MDLNQIRDQIRAYPGLTRKLPIEDVYRQLVLGGPQGAQLPNYGDDAATMPFKDGYLLMSADGIMTGLLINEPYAAGKASVMVTVNDIYSMGGRPLAMVNVLASGDPEQRSQIVAGIRKGCLKLNVPMVGGHLHPDAASETPHLAVAILGWAEKVIRGFTANPGDNLILAVDLTGQAGCKSVVSWDANSGKTTGQLLDRLETMPTIAQKGLASSAKDVSNAGLLGTVSIMMENSRLGCAIDLDQVPTPDTLSLSSWMLCFQSFGFILAVPPQNTGEVLAIFREKKLAAEVIGQTTAERQVVLRTPSDSTVLFDFTREKITGVVRPEEV